VLNGFSEVLSTFLIVWPITYVCLIGIIDMVIWVHFGIPFE